MEHQRYDPPGGGLTGTTNTPSAGPSPPQEGARSSAAGGAMGREHRDSERSAAGRPAHRHRAVDRLRAGAVTRAEAQKARAVRQVERLAHGLRRTGETLHEEGSEPFANLASSAAEGVQRVGSYLGRNDVEEVLRDLRTAARRHPAAVFGTALLAGILAGRFLRSSRPAGREIAFDPDPSLLDPDVRISGLEGGGIGDTGSTGFGDDWSFGERPGGGWA